MAGLLRLSPAIRIMAEDRLKVVHQRAEIIIFRRWCTDFSRSLTSPSGHNANCWAFAVFFMALLGLCVDFSLI
jgi:hypothetical protein